MSELLQERIQILLDRLQWTYITLWILDPRTRMLEWKRGHFQVAREREYALLLYSKYRTCCFTPGIGAVGRAILEEKTVWLTGASVCQQAGSIEHSQFLRGAEIKTMLCIPWVDSVLEIGTVNVVAESLVLTDRLQQVLAKDLLSIANLEPEPAVTSRFQESNVSPRVDHPTNSALQPPSSITLSAGAGGHLPLAEQQWRSASNFTLGLSSFDVLTPEPESSSRQRQSESRDRASERSSEAAAAEGGNISFEMAVSSQSRGLMTDQYNTTTGPMWAVANSSSTATGSSREGSSARTSVSPELRQDPAHAHSNSFANPRFSADDSQLAEPRNQNRRANSCGEYEIQREATLLEPQELHQQWRQQLQQNPAVGQTLPFQANWRRDTSQLKTGDQQLGSMGQSTTRTTAKRSNVELMNQVSKIAGPLIRRQNLSALKLLKGADDLYQRGGGAATTTPAEAPVPYKNMPVQVLQEVNPSLFEINRPSRRAMGEELPGCSGPEHAGHDEAAVSHMLAERRRRTKQNENFSILRRLVPIISKGDKVSTLVDTITYLKFLQNKVQVMEAIKQDIDRRCHALENKCKGLRDRNQELVDILSSKDPPSGTRAIHLNLVHLKL